MRVRRASDAEIAEAEDDTSSDEDSSSEDLSDSDADVDMPDESLMDQIMRTEQALQRDPTRYASHAKLVRLLRDANLRERLRDAREAMSSRFPLNETQWREWIADEVRHTKGKREARATVVGALFERAVADYVSVALWLGYAEFSLDQDWDHDRRRELYERALELAGLHFTDGHRVFAAYRAFELSILRRVEDDPAAAPEDRARAESRVRALFRRQLAVPHAQLEETRAMAEAWESARPGAERRAKSGFDGVDATAAAASDPAAASAAASASTPASLPPETLAAYAKASSSAAALRPFEDAIVAAAASPKPARALAKAHRAHVSATEAENRRANLDPSDASARARAAYERAVSATPTDAALWRRYTAHVDATCRVRVTRAATHERATRNCPGDGETWASAIRFFFAESEAGSDAGNEDAARRTFDRALVAGLATAEDELVVRLAGVHCGLCGWDDARDGVASSRPGWIDARLRLPTLRAERELRGPSGDPDRAAAVWEEHCAGAGADVGEAHAARAEFLWRCLGRTEEARAELKRRFAQEGLASAAKPDEPGWAPVCRAWIRMERAVGTPAQFLEADAKAGAKLRALEAEAAERDALDPEEAKRMRREKDPNYKKAAKKATDRADGKGKRKASETETETNAAGDGDGDGDGDARASKRPRGDGPRASAAAETAPEDAEKLPEDPTARAAKYKEYYPDRDARTAFVRNLPFKCTEDELAAFFDARGGTATARIVKDKSTGKSRGFAYVDFSEEGALQLAIMRDGATFQGRTLSIARSMPPGGGGSKGGEGKAGKPPGGPARRGGLGLGVGMMPRAARAAATAAAAGGGSEAAAAPKSNADFRAMMLAGFKKGANLE